ncbi:hypothetical protein PV327_004453 [Microctonus hyperodae]|uniref:Uncharacterized protein n=1 Tax=Microctonus hyperodae TaxID=165561 RepID=A0AA39FCF3_MICHY|nr:hypothetical protein PV327_004453 [Microctonus hyperodae]
MWIVLRCDDADTQRATLHSSDYGYAMWTMIARIFERWTNVNITKRDERRERQWYGYGHEMHGIRFVISSCLIFRDKVNLCTRRLGENVPMQILALKTLNRRATPPLAYSKIAIQMHKGLCRFGLVEVCLTGESA